MTGPVVLGGQPWVDYLEGRNPGYPAQALRADLTRLGQKIQAQKDDKTTPDTRLADNALDINPASVTALMQLTQGAIHIARPPWTKTSSTRPPS